jgi:hypothetical protein
MLLFTPAVCVGSEPQLSRLDLLRQTKRNESLVFQVTIKHSDQYAGFFFKMARF